MYNPNQMYGINPNYNYQGMQMPQVPTMPSQLQGNSFRNMILQGKQIDSLDVVKATDIPLDGSISYFPLADGTAIATKQLQQDGTSKITIYKVVDNADGMEQPKYITAKELKDAISKIDISDFNDKFKKIDRQIEDITDDIKKLSKKEK